MKKYYFLFVPQCLVNIYTFEKKKQNKTMAEFRKYLHVKSAIIFQFKFHSFIWNKRLKKIMPL